MAAPDIYDAANKAKLRELLDEQTRLKRELEHFEVEWLDLTDRIEKIQTE